MNKKNPDISISIVNYNSFDYLLNCLRAVLEHSRDFDVEILIVDNASKYFDSSLIYDIWPDAIITYNKKNMGFAYAQNQNFKLSNGHYFLLLNPDTLITAGCLQEIIKVFDNHKNAAIVSPTLLLRNTTFYVTHKELPTIKSALRELLFINQL